MVCKSAEVRPGGKRIAHRLNRPAASGWLPIAALALAGLLPGCTRDDEPPATLPDPHVASLAALSVDELRRRSYGSEPVIVSPIPGKLYESYMLAYRSDGLRVYARFDLPTSPAPDSGYPVIVFLHGWMNADAAPALRFYYDEDSDYGAMIDAYVDAGFAVLTPGWRGHGTVEGIPADGIEYVEAWDNGSYLGPVFYAIDVLNLLDGLSTLDSVDPSAVNLVAHSQGGDVALIVLAAAGEQSGVDTTVTAASIWSGTFPPRFTQLETYPPMQKSPEAFMSGDGTWTGTAIGRDGSVNPRFVFGYPADWIETVDRSEWTWQHDTWDAETTLGPLRQALDEMYAAINGFVADIDDAEYVLEALADGSLSVAHDARVAGAMRRIGGFHAVEFLSEPLALHHSDRDFHSFPEWNADLCRRINEAGGRCYDFEYAGSNHALRESEHEWFAPKETVGGWPYAIRRDIALFRGSDPGKTEFP